MARIKKFKRNDIKLGKILTPKITKSDLDRIEKNDFIRKTRERFEKNLQHFLINNGYFLSNVGSIYSVNMEELENNVNNIKIIDAIGKFNNITENIADGGRLTSKKRDDLLNTIYILEDFNSKCSNSNLILWEKYIKLKPRRFFKRLILFFLYYFIVCFILGLFKFNSEKLPSIALIICVIGAIIKNILDSKKRKKSLDILWPEIEKTFKEFD